LTQHTVAIQQVQQILQGARSQGRDVVPLLQRAGIPPALLDAPLARVSLIQYALLIRVLRRATRDELWGLCDRPLRPGSLGQCAALGLHCSDLEQALRAGFRHFHGLQSDFVPRLLLQGDTARVQLVCRAAPGARLDYAQKAFLLFSFGLACWWVARRVPLLGVDYTAPVARSDSSRVYQAPIREGQPHIGLSFEARWLRLPVVQNAQSLREFLARAPADLLIRYRDPSRVSERIRRLLRRRLGSALPALDDISQALAMTPQTLRRRLHEEGHGFQALKDGLRRDAAIEDLARPELTLMDIANRLGFSEPSTFQRAFKKWTGVAPGEYRSTRLVGPVGGVDGGVDGGIGGGVAAIAPRASPVDPGHTHGFATRSRDS
jgi:AraC-like DNA-binding protein